MVIVTIFLAYKGYVSGMTREIISFISMIVLVAFVWFVIRAIEQFRVSNYEFILESIVIFVVTMIFLKIGGVLLIPLKAIARLSLVKYVDRLLGIVIGVVKGVLYLKLITMIIFVFDGSKVSSYFVSDIGKSELLSVIVYGNYLEMWAEKIF